jgi:oxygen-independent coproporphyrinogen-3 oxidase
VTVEANPDSVDAASLAALRESGITRVSIGMQSGAPHVLALWGAPTTQAGLRRRPARRARRASTTSAST